MCGEMCTSVARASFLARGYVSSLYYTFMAALNYCKKRSNNTSVKQLGKKKSVDFTGAKRAQEKANVYRQKTKLRKLFSNFILTHTLHTQRYLIKKHTLRVVQMRVVASMGN